MQIFMQKKHFTHQKSYAFAVIPIYQRSYT